MLRYSPVLLASALLAAASLAGCDRSGGGSAEGGDPGGLASGETIPAASGSVDSDVPELAPGRWRVTVASQAGPEFPPETVCLTEADVRAKKSIGERALELPCDERNVTKEGDAVVTRAVCDVGGIKRTIETRATGDFKSDYYIDYVENIDPPPAEAPAEIRRRLHARLLGDC